MKTICCYCNKHLKGDPNDKEISHGACKECHDRVLKEFKEERNEKAYLALNTAITY